MNKLQIQLPSPTYNDLKALSAILDYPMADLVRRGIEHVLLLYPQHTTHIHDQKATWTYPKPKKLGLKISDPEMLKEFANSRDVQLEAK